MNPVTARRPPRWAIDLVFGLGLAAALPLLVATFFFGSWISVPAHRAVEDSASLPIYSSADLMLHYTPFLIVLALLICMCAARFAGKRSLAASLSFVQIAGLTVLVGTGSFFIA